MKFKKVEKNSIQPINKLSDKKVEIETQWIYLAEEVGFKVAQEFHIE